MAAGGEGGEEWSWGMIIRKDFISFLFTLNTKLSFLITTQIIITIWTLITLFIMTRAALFNLSYYEILNIEKIDLFQQTKGINPFYLSSNLLINFLVWWRAPKDCLQYYSLYSIRSPHFKSPSFPLTDDNNLSFDHIIDNGNNDNNNNDNNDEYFVEREI